MAYQLSSIRTLQDYSDRNQRERYMKKEAVNRTLPFPFLRMDSGQYFDATIPNKDVESTRVMLHQNARLANIWIRTRVVRKDKNETVIRVIHDGKRA